MNWKAKLPQENRYYEVDTGILYKGNCIDILKLFPENYIDLVVTSPPYDDLREYTGKASWNFDVFKQTAHLLYKVVKKGGVVVWVVGDATIKGSETGTSFRQALYFKDNCGFKLYDTMIYAKQNYIPYNHKRYDQAFEYMFVFSKGIPSVFNPIKIRTKTEGEIKDYSKMKARGSKIEEKSLIKIANKKVKTGKYRIKSNIWEYLIGSYHTTKKSFVYDHPAVFPEQLAKDHIFSWTNENMVVLDPLCGSGTVLEASEKLNRRWIGIEIEEKYCEIAKKRIEIYKKQGKLFK